MKLLHEELSSKVIKAFYNVYNELGFGFLEKVYENALMNELRDMGVDCWSQRPIEVYYKGEKVGQYYADIVVEDLIIVELKASKIHESHIYQLLNYMKATDIEVGLLMSFGQEAKFERRIFMNTKK